MSESLFLQKEMALTLLTGTRARAWHGDMGASHWTLTQGWTSHPSVCSLGSPSAHLGDLDPFMFSLSVGVPLDP